MDTVLMLQVPFAWIYGQKYSQNDFISTHVALQMKYVVLYPLYQQFMLEHDYLLPSKVKTSPSGTFEWINKTMYVCHLIINLQHIPGNIPSQRWSICSNFCQQIGVDVYCWQLPNTTLLSLVQVHIWWIYPEIQHILQLYPQFGPLDVLKRMLSYHTGPRNKYIHYSCKTYFFRAIHCGYVLDSQHFTNISTKVAPKGQIMSLNLVRVCESSILSRK